MSQIFVGEVVGCTIHVLYYFTCQLILTILHTDQQ